MSAFSQAVHGRGPSSGRLEFAAAAVGRWMHDTGLRPERGVIALKALVRTASDGWNPSLVERALAEPSARAATYGRAFGVWVAAYYRP